MAVISSNAGSYALIAAVSLKDNADTLRKLAQAAGNSVSTTQTKLTTQSQDLKRFVDKVSPEADAAAELEKARGVTRSAEISQGVADALKAAQQRFALAEARNASRPAGASAFSAGAALVEVLKSANQDNEDAFDFSALIAPKSNGKVKPTEINVTVASQDKADVFDRGIPLTAAVGGSATISVKKTALRGEAVDVLLDKGNPSLGGIQGVNYLADGAARSGNEGFYIRSDTGRGNDTVVLDTRDGANEDTRLSSIDLSTGDGSDVVFIAGNNVSRIDAGAGDDFVAVEGDAIVDGGDGNDLIFARTASGDAGDDVIFSDGFASGGEGNDVITLFSLDEETDTNAKIAYGGEGDDQIVASVKADVDGGAGNDVLVLRSGGTAGGGEGDDTISAWATATVEGGAGDDDIRLLYGGGVDGGEGNDKIETGNYASVSGGLGDDEVTLSGGGVYTFRKGDGADNVEFLKTRFALDDADKTRLNRIVLDGFDPADVNLTVDAVSLKAAPTAAGSADKLTVDREVLGKIEVVFRKNGYEQTLTVDGLTQTLGPRTVVTS